MIIERDGDLLTQPDLTHIAHQANLYHCFGAGLAAAIKERYPYAYAADCATNYGHPDKLGWYSDGVPASGSADPIVINLYCQRGLGARVATDYEAMRHALCVLVRNLEAEKYPIHLGLPHGLGCGLAGGDWKRVRPILGGVFARSSVTAIIVRLPG